MNLHDAQPREPEIIVYLRGRWPSHGWHFDGNNNIGLSYPGNGDVISETHSVAWWYDLYEIEFNSWRTNR